MISISKLASNIYYLLLYLTIIILKSSSSDKDVFEFRVISGDGEYFSYKFREFTDLKERNNWVILAVGYYLGAETLSFKYAPSIGSNEYECTAIHHIHK